MRYCYVRYGVFGRRHTRAHPGRRRHTRWRQARLARAVFRRCAHAAHPFGAIFRQIPSAARVLARPRGGWVAWRRRARLPHAAACARAVRSLDTPCSVLLLTPSVLLLMPLVFLLISLLLLRSPWRCSSRPPSLIPSFLRATHRRSLSARSRIHPTCAALAHTEPGSSTEQTQPVHAEPLFPAPRAHASRGSPLVSPRCI